MSTATYSDLIQLPSSVIRALRGRLGERAQAWITDELPTVVQSCREKWNLDVAEALPGGCTAVVLSVRHKNQPCVLKLHPDPDLFDAELHGWQLWAGRSMPNLIASDSNLRVLLQERVVPGMDLVSVPEQTVAAQAAADVLADLHATNVPACFAPLSERISRWLERAERLAKLGTVVTSDMILQARNVAEDLLSGTTHSHALHGDFYPDNVLWSERQGKWLAIDPEPCQGDRAFDAATWSYAYGRGEHLNENVEVFATRMGLSAQRIHGWSFMVAVTNLALRTAYGHASTREVTSGLAAIRQGSQNLVK